MVILLTTIMMMMKSMKMMMMMIAGVLPPGEVDSRGQTQGDGDRLDGTLLEVDHVADFHEEAVEALFQ